MQAASAPTWTPAPATAATQPAAQTASATTARNATAQQQLGLGRGGTALGPYRGHPIQHEIGTQSASSPQQCLRGLRNQNHWREHYGFTPFDLGVDQRNSWFRLWTGQLIPLSFFVPLRFQNARAGTWEQRYANSCKDTQTYWRVVYPLAFETMEQYVERRRQDATSRGDMSFTVPHAEAVWLEWARNPANRLWVSRDEDIKHSVVAIRRHAQLHERKIFRDRFPFEPTTYAGRNDADDDDDSEDDDDSDDPDEEDDSDDEEDDDQDEDRRGLLRQQQARQQQLRQQQASRQPSEDLYGMTPPRSTPTPAVAPGYQQGYAAASGSAPYFARRPSGYPTDSSQPSYSARVGTAGVSTLGPSRSYTGNAGGQSFGATSAAPPRQTQAYQGEAARDPYSQDTRPYNGRYLDDDLVTLRSGQVVPRSWAAQRIDVNTNLNTLYLQGRHTVNFRGEPHERLAGVPAYETRTDHRRRQRDTLGRGPAAEPEIDRDYSQWLADPANLDYMPYAGEGRDARTRARRRLEQAAADEQRRLEPRQQPQIAAAPAPQQVVGRRRTDSPEPDRGHRRRHRSRSRDRHRRRRDH